MIRAPALALAVTLAGCPKSAPAPAAPSDDEVSDAGDNGPVAGPHAVIEGSAPPPPPPDTPGFGPLHPYIGEVRRPVTDRMRTCVENKAPDAAAEQPALIRARIGSDGVLQEVTLTRSSGVEAIDQCLLAAFRQAELPVPPAEILAEDGAVQFEIAFR